MSRKSSVHEISPRLATKGRAREVRYPIPNPSPSAEEYVQIVKEGVAMLRGLHKNLEYYSPGDDLAGAHLVSEARSRIDAAASLLESIASENGKGGARLHRFFMRHLADGEQRHREHIRIDVHNVLDEICRAIGERMRAETRGERNADTDRYWLRMVKDAERRFIEGF